jgi:uncharacterized short protein YbdD (DUF466 family)
MRRSGWSVRELLERLSSTVRRVIGAPDHEAYLAHMRRHHPEQTPLSREAFAHDALRRRYDQPGSRCC